MDPVAVATRIERGAHQFPQRDLGLGILRAYERHDLAPLLLGKDVGHLKQAYLASSMDAAKCKQMGSVSIRKSM